MSTVWGTSVYQRRVAEIPLAVCVSQAEEFQVWDDSFRWEFSEVKAGGKAMFHNRIAIGVIGIALPLFGLQLLPADGSAQPSNFVFH